MFSKNSNRQILLCERIFVVFCFFPSMTSLRWLRMLAPITRSEVSRSCWLVIGRGAERTAATATSTQQPSPGCSQASMILSQNNFYAADPSLCRLQASADEDRNKIELQTIHRISEVLQSQWRPLGSSHGWTTSSFTFKTLSMIKRCLRTVSRCEMNFSCLLTMGYHPFSIVGAFFNQEKILVGAFSMIVKTDG